MGIILFYPNSNSFDKVFSTFKSLVFPLMHVYFFRNVYILQSDKLTQNNIKQPCSFMSSVTMVRKRGSQIGRKLLYYCVHCSADCLQSDRHRLNQAVIRPIILRQTLFTACKTEVERRRDSLSKFIHLQVPVSSISKLLERAPPLEEKYVFLLSTQIAQMSV